MRVYVYLLYGERVGVRENEKNVEGKVQFIR